ncbi:hypothetical protein BaRGS_00040313 [Batillaria attramentaria]|uniref:Uncharacterized protein n=1 Tax=Batillaria attramentaria TaxID=370345 RepID=A0ABD0J0K6_9CAEN
MAVVCTVFTAGGGEEVTATWWRGQWPLSVPCLPQVEVVARRLQPRGGEDSGRCLYRVYSRAEIAGRDRAGHVLGAGAVQARSTALTFIPVARACEKHGAVSVAALHVDWLTSPVAARALTTGVVQ